MSKKMRWIAGALYGVLSVYEMLVLRYILSSAAITDLPIALICQVVLMTAAGAMAVWLLAGAKALSKEKQRGITVATGLVVIFQLITYATQVIAIDSTLSVLFPSLLTTGSTMYQLVGMLVRMLLLVLAAFFVQSAGVEADTVESLAKEAEEEVEELEETLEKLEEAVKEEMLEALNEQEEANEDDKKSE